MKYDRYWDLHITANNGWYEWAPYIRANAAYQSGKIQPGAGPLFLTTTPPATGIIADVPIPATGLPITGVVASAITMQTLNPAYVVPAPKAAELSAIVAWIDDRSHVGKLRVNVHGDPGGAGVIIMANGPANAPGYQQDFAIIGNLIALLRAHGLQRSSRLNPSTYHSYFGKGGSTGRGGLSTINLAICHSSKAGTIGGTPMFSGVDQVVRSLKSERAYGIEVTGTDVASQISPSLDATLVLPTVIANQRNAVTAIVAAMIDADLRNLVRGRWHSLTLAEQGSIYRASGSNQITPKFNAATRAELISTLTVINIVDAYNAAGYGGGGKWGFRPVGGGFQTLAHSNVKVRKFATWTQG